MRIGDPFSPSRDLEASFKQLEGCDESIELHENNFAYRCLVGPGSPYQGAMLGEFASSKMLAVDILREILKYYFENSEEFKKVLKVVDQYSTSDIDDIALINPDYFTHISHLTKYFVNNLKDDDAVRLLSLKLAPCHMIPLDTNLEIFYKEGGITFNVHIPDDGFGFDYCNNEEIAKIKRIEKSKDPHISEKDINRMINNVYMPYDIYVSFDIKLDPSKIKAYKFIDSNSEESQENHQANNILKIKIVK